MFAAGASQSIVAAQSNTTAQSAHVQKSFANVGMFVIALPSAAG